MNDATEGNNTENLSDETAYADAVIELEDILTALEDDNIDVDALASKVERASHLIGLCRERISAAKVQVEQVVAELDTAHPDTTDLASDQAEAE